MFRILSKDFRQEVAYVAIAWSWTRSMRCPAFHRPNAMLTSRWVWVFSCDFDLHSEVLRVARHTVDTQFLHCRWIAETTQLDNIQFNLFIQPGLPSEVSSSSAVVVSKKLWLLLVPATALSSRRFFSRLFASPKAYRRGRLSDGHIAMKLNKTHFNINSNKWQLWINKYSLRSPLPCSLYQAMSGDKLAY